MTKKDVSVLTYARDALSAPLRGLQYVVTRVRKKDLFTPTLPGLGGGLRRANQQLRKEGL